MVSVEAQIEACQLEYWWHIYSPLDMWDVYETIAEGVHAVKAEYQEARAAGDRDRADALALEVIDLTELAAACADGLAASRARFLSGDRPWPLAPVAVR
jgi:hypothetical protein